MDGDQFQPAAAVRVHALQNNQLRGKQRFPLENCGITPCITCSRVPNSTCSKTYCCWKHCKVHNGRKTGNQMFALAVWITADQRKVVPCVMCRLCKLRHRTAAAPSSMACTSRAASANRHADPYHDVDSLSPCCGAIH